MNNVSCSICGDEKHILNSEGLWIRCDCLKKEMFNQKLIEACISFPLKELTLDNIQINYPHTQIDPELLNFCKTKFFKTLSSGEKPKKIFCFQGRVDGAKDLILQTSLLQAIKGGLKVTQTSMEQLILKQFRDGGLSLEDEFMRSDILCVGFGSEPQHNISGDFLQSLIRLNWLHPQKYLILHTNLRWDDISDKYGDSVQNLFVKVLTPDTDKRVYFSCVEKI